METPEDASVVNALREAATKVLGQPPQIAGVPFWTDAAVLSAAGIPSLLFGPSGAGAHVILTPVKSPNRKDTIEITPAPPQEEQK
jgi:acetylornithine deacetylase/succinyl-diaminopimelate desuccinylase-like protein